MKREDLSSDCKLDPLLTIAIMMGGIEHPCDRCNMDRKECRGYPRLEENDGTKGDSNRVDS